MATQTERHRANWQDEIDSVALYRALADLEADPRLADVYRRLAAKGLDAEAARELAARQIADRSTALDTLAREELGIDPDELAGSALVAASASFVLFAIGAILPVLPYFFLSGTSAVIVSAGLSAIGLFTIGALITVFTGRGALFSGGRQVVIGGAAAALTYVVGLVIGGAVGV